jgi:hypothetical protein
MNNQTAISAACSWPVRSPSSVTPGSMAPSIAPSRPCGRDGRPRLLLLRLPTSSRE